MNPGAAAGESRQVYQTLCRMCDDHCAVNAYLEEGRVVDIDGYAEHPWNRGRLCSKGRAAVDLVYHPDRLWKPLKRTASGWQEIPLDQALEEIAGKLARIRDVHGARSIGVWKGEAVGFAQQEDMARRFIHAIGSPNYFSNDSLCFNGRWIGYSTVHGAWSVPDYEHTRLVLLWGSNPPHAHPNMTQMIMRARRRGARLIVLDPRLSAIARQADLHAPVRPGTDGAMAWGLIRALLERGAYDRELVERHSVGFAELQAYAGGFTPQLVEKETGVPAALVEQIASALASAAPAVVNYVGNGLEHHENGINNIRAVAYLDALLGALDRKGGNRLAESFPTQRLTLYQERPLTELDPIGAERFPVLYGMRRECHSMTAMDTILSGRPYPPQGHAPHGRQPGHDQPQLREGAQSPRCPGAVRGARPVPHRDRAPRALRAARGLLPGALRAARFTPCSRWSPSAGSCSVLPRVQDEFQFWRDLAHRLGAGYFPWKDEEEPTRWLLEPTGLTLEQVAGHPEGYRWPSATGSGGSSLWTPPPESGVHLAIPSRTSATCVAQYRPPAYRLCQDTE